MLFRQWLIWVYIGVFGILGELPCHAQLSNGNLEMRRPTVVFMGNSITLGWKTYYPEFFENGYMVNKGIGGQTTSQMRERFSQDVLAINPQIVVLMGGTNDIAGLGGETTVDAIFDNLKAMVDMAVDNGIAVVLCSVLPAHAYGCCPAARPIPMIAALNAKLQEYADNSALIYVDYYSLLVDERKGIDAQWTVDGVHPNKAGYVKMIPPTLAAIFKSL